MANETVRSKAADRLADLISPGMNGEFLAAVLREGSKIVVMTQTQYDALASKDSNTIYITTP
jgi:hypothetical protein